MAKRQKRPEFQIVKDAANRRPGRPVVNEMPELIPDTPENVLRAVLAMPEMKADDWEYMRDRKRRPRAE